MSGLKWKKLSPTHFVLSPAIAVELRKFGHRVWFLSAQDPFSIDSLALGEEEDDTTIEEAKKKAIAFMGIEPRSIFGY